MTIIKPMTLAERTSYTMAAAIDKVIGAIAIGGSLYLLHRL